MTTKLGIVVLVLLILVLALPLGMGMAMGHCPECTVGPGNPIPAYALLSEGALILAGIGAGRLRAAEDRALGLLLTRRLDRPPRFA